MSWPNKLAKLQQLSWAQRGLLLEAILWLALARLSLLLVPFRRIAPYLGTAEAESEPIVDPATQKIAAEIGWAVRVMARRTPWESACLARSISAKRMLRRRQIHSTLYLGLAKDKSQALQAHAWLRCGEAIISGKAEHERFSMIASFAERPSPASSPTDTAQSLLLAVLNPIHQPTTASQLRQMDAAEWDALARLAKKQKVSTLFFARLEALDVETAVPPRLWAMLKQTYQQITLQNLSMYRELHLINQALQAENIPLVLLKGAYLATAVYPHIGQRAMGDLDLLIPPDNLAQAVDILHGMGWYEQRPFTLETILQQHHHLPPLTKKETNFYIEPHWHITHATHATHATPIGLAELWQQTRAVGVAGTEALAFTPHLQLLHLALHASYNHQFAFDLRSLCDIALLITQQEAQIEWDQLVEKAIAWEWQRGVYLTLVLVQEFWNTAVPLRVLDQLKPDAMPAHMITLAKQQIMTGYLQNKKVSKNFAALQGNKTRWEKAKFIFSFFFPSRSRLAWQYGIPANSNKIWRYYFINMRILISRNAKRTWHMLRGTNQFVEVAERRNQLSTWLTNTK